MCGVFGAFVRGTAPFTAAQLRAALKVLAEKSQSRGRDSSGLVFRDERERVYRVLKGAVALEALFRSRDAATCLDEALSAYGKRRETFAAMGHSRLVTNGSQRRPANNQPVLRRGLLAIHNGIIVNVDALWQRHPELQRELEIDTEILLCLIRKQLEDGRDLPGATARALAEIEGTVATAILFDDRASLLLATNNGSLYTLAAGHDALFFASESYPLEVVADRLKLSGSADIRQLKSGTGAVVSLDTFEIERFEVTAALERARPAAVATLEPRFHIRELSIANGHSQQELVADVALFATARRSAAEEALLEYNWDEVDRLRRCERCILPETFPFIRFDDAGLCNYCKNYRLKNEPKPFSVLLELVEPYRRRNGTPDCIVPFSGGRDSTFALHTIKTRLGLNPIAFTYDWGMVTDLGRRNIARACGKLGVENIIIAADIRKKRDNIRKNLLAWLERPHLGMIPIFMAGDKFFYYYVGKVKRETRIPLNIWGVNPLENTDFKVGFMGVPPDHDKKRIYSLSLARQLKLFVGATKAIKANPHYLNSSVWDTAGSFVSRMILPHTDYYHLYDYVRWDENEVNQLVLDEYGWETAVDTATTWRIGDGTAALYNYIYFNVAGFSEHETFRSNQIREGMLTRDAALRHAREDNRPRYPTIKWYTEIVDVEFASAIRTVNAIPKLYR